MIRCAAVYDKHPFIPANTREYHSFVLPESLSLLSHRSFPWEELFVEFVSLHPSVYFAGRDDFFVLFPVLLHINRFFSETVSFEEEASVL